jgi:hypothetical protein
MKNPDFPKFQEGTALQNSRRILRKDPRNFYNYHKIILINPSKISGKIFLNPDWKIWKNFGLLT